MRFAEPEIYQGIKTRLTDAGIASHFTDEGHAVPKEVRLYNNDYEEPSNTLPFNRDAVLVEYGSYEWTDVGGYQKATIPVVLHVVQDLFVSSGSNLPTEQDTAYQDKLKYTPLVEELIHQHQIDNCILSVTGVDPVQNLKNLMIHKVSVEARVKVKRLGV